MSAHFIDVKPASLSAVSSGAVVLWSEMVTSQGSIEHDDTIEDDTDDTLQRRGYNIYCDGGCLNAEYTLGHWITLVLLFNA